jgi:hypothetical protein
MMNDFNNSPAYPNIRSKSETKNEPQLNKHACALDTYSKAAKAPPCAATNLDTILFLNVYC